MEKITKTQYIEASELIELYKMQNEPKTVQVSVTYDCKLSNTITVPQGWSIEKIKKELENGANEFYYDFEAEEDIEYVGISELFIDGKSIEL